MRPWPEGTVPVKSTDCRYCHEWSPVARVRYTGSCEQHPAGADYAGDDAYEPSEFVKETVGRRYLGPWGEHTYECTGYDPRCGFWMRNVADPSDLRDVSERAIGRTYHRIWKP